MKTLRISMIALLSATALTAQDLNMEEVPAELMAKFQQEYPNATDVEWEKEGDAYEVEFDHEGEEHEVWYSADGKSPRSERDISEDDLPEAVRSAISTNFEGYKVDSVKITEEDGNTTYEVELEKGWTEEKDVVFDADGNVISEKDD